MDTAVLRAKIKQNLIINYNTDDDLIDGFADAAVAYAEKYQHLDSGYYAGHDMSATTEQAVIMLASHFYESRDGSTGGFFADNVSAGEQAFATADRLLRLDREWQV